MHFCKGFMPLFDTGLNQVSCACGCKSVTLVSSRLRPYHVCLLSCLALVVRKVIPDMV